MRSVMKSVWITGCNCYELLGLVSFLEAEGVVARVYRPGDRFGEGDRLIIGLSGVPLLGWWRYLKILGWLARRYEKVWFIVMCPEVVYVSGMTDGEKIMSVNGSMNLTLLTASLLRCLRDERSDEASGIVRCSGRRRGGTESRIAALRCRRMRLIKTEYGIQLRKEYRLRARLLRKAGFYTFLALNVFMAGCRDKEAFFSGGQKIPDAGMPGTMPDEEIDGDHLYALLEK